MGWHNDVSRLLLDIDEALRNAADERVRNALIRKLASVLRDADEASCDRQDTQRGRS